MKKINVKICIGTTCFVMGASKLQNFNEFIPKKWKNLVDIRTFPCLDLCKNNEYTKSPYVTIDNEILSEATIDKLIEAIEKKIIINNLGNSYE